MVIYCWCSMIRTEYELTYGDSGNTRQFLFFTMQFSPPTQKIMIPISDNFFMNGETKAKLLL